MAVPVFVLTSVTTGMKRLWQSCQNTRHTKYKSLHDDILNREEIHVFLKFVMSLIVSIIFASITANAIFVFDPENQDGSFVVTELCVTSKTDTSVSLDWTKPVLEATRYEVQSSSQMSDDLAMEVDAWTTTSFSLDQLTPGVQYSFSVTSFVTSDDGQEMPLRSKIISVILKPSPPGPISKSRILKSHVELSWEASPGHTDSYSVVLKNCLGDLVAEASTESTHLTIALGRTLTVYVVEICALSYRERSDPRTAVVHVEESDLSVQDLHATTQDTNSVTLEWSPPVYTAMERYEVLWSPNQPNVINVDPDTTWSSIGDLTPGQLYKFSVTTVLPLQCGEEERVHSQAISVITRPAVPGMVDRMQSTIKSTSMNLQWKASEGRVDRYIVKIADDSPFQAEYKTDGPSVLIENLEINTLYQVEFYAVRGNMMSELRTEVLKTKDIQVYWGCMTKAILTGGIAVAGVTSFAPVLGVFGFGAAGIGKGTLAASWMSSYGGAVASGGLFSTLQSLGVVGLGAAAKAAIIGSGIALGCIMEVA